MKEMTLQCRQRVAKQHAKLEHVDFICQLLKTLIQCTADICTALEAVLLLFRITLHHDLHFLYTPGNSHSRPEIPCALKVTILLLFCVGSSKSLVH